MSLKDIEKLKERVDKDPNSKLFVPLAEEYRKEGMLDEAVTVLLSGLEKQPGYVSAKVSLGKIYLEKGQLPEARGEFEQVIRAIPDNLFAHKKLAELYRDTGEKDLAMKAFKTVLNLNPKDDEALTQLKDLERLEAEAPAEPTPVPEKTFGEVSLPETGEEPFLAEEPPPAEEVAEDDLADFKDSIFGVKEEEAGPDSLAASADDAIEIAEESATAEEGLSLGNIDEEVRLVTPAVPDISEHLIVEEIKAQPSIQAAPAPEPPAAQDETATFDQAEQCIAAGDFPGALSVYRKMLAANPSDKKALQRAEELRGLLKLMGRDKDALIEKLNALLESIQKRRDEFLRHS